MKTCPWCGHENLNVYVYCQRCGRGFEAPPEVTNGRKGGGEGLIARLKKLLVPSR